METTSEQTTAEQSTAGPDAPEASAPSSPAEPSAEASALPERTARQAWPYAAVAAAYLLGPLVIGLTLPPAAATTALLALLPVAALALGAADGAIFRPTWAFPVITGLICWFALRIFTNDGTWIYAVGVVVLCRLGVALGGRRKRG